MPATKILFSNTLTGKKESFSPISNKEILMYNCGPTVYSRAHIGNLRSYVFADTIRRLLQLHGFEVKQVINITDVGHLTDDADDGEDKIEKAAKKQNSSATEITNHYTNLFIKDLDKLNINTSEILFPRATEFIDAQIELIQKIEKLGYAYKTDDGIYFDTSKFRDYGKLGQVDTHNIQEGARIGKNSQKRNPTDFALWKFSNPDEKRQQEWDSPWGVGFPGWHIECSSMIWKLLGEHIDIHTGGIEHIPVHHNNEIAQSESVFGPNLSNYWLHLQHLLVDNKKMSKSLGNIVTLDDLEEQGYTPEEFRFFTLGAHYKSYLNFTWEALSASKNALSKIRAHFEEFSETVPVETSSPYCREALDALSDDLNTPKVISILFDMLKDKSLSSELKAQIAKYFEQMLGVPLVGVKKCINNTLSQELKEKLNAREQARKQKDFQTADKIRKDFADLGYQIKDTPSGPCVYKI